MEASSWGELFGKAELSIRPTSKVNAINDGTYVERLS